MALAEETSAGVTYFITEVASMRGLRSAGIAALLLRARLSFCVTILHTIVMIQPSQSALSEQRVRTGRLAQHMEPALDIFSCHDLPRIRRVLLRWFVELFSILSCLAYIAVKQQCTGIADCHLLSSPTVRGLPTLESLDEHIMRGWHCLRSRSV